MKRNILMVVVLALLVLALALFTDIQSVEDYYLTHMEDIAPDSETVTISIRCDTVLDNWDKLEEIHSLRRSNPAGGHLCAASWRYGF